MSENNDLNSVGNMDEIKIQIDDASESDELVNFHDNQKDSMIPFKPKQKRKASPNQSSYRTKIYNGKFSGERTLQNPSSAPICYRNIKKSRRKEMNDFLWMSSFGNNNIQDTRKIPRLIRTNSKSRNNNTFRESESDESNYYEETMPINYNIQRSSSQLIDEHLQEIQIRVNGHTQAALRYEKRDRIIGYPVTLLSSFIASTLMMNVSNNRNNDQRVVDIVGFSLSVVSFVLSLSREYLKYTTKFQAHDISAKLYTNLLRSIEVRLIGNHITSDDKRDMFKDIVDQMSIIEQYELPIPSDINKKIRSGIFLPRSVVINNALRKEENRE